MSQDEAHPGTPELLLIWAGFGGRAAGMLGDGGWGGPLSMAKETLDSSAKVLTAKQTGAGWMAALGTKGEHVTLTIIRGWGAAALAKGPFTHRGLLREPQEFRGAEGSPLLQSPRFKAPSGFSSAAPTGLEYRPPVPIPSWH